MRIAELRRTASRCRSGAPTARAGGAAATARRALQAVLVEIDTDEGVTGIGEAPVVWAGRPRSPAR